MSKRQVWVIEARDVRVKDVAWEYIRPAEGDEADRGELDHERIGVYEYRVAKYVPEDK